MSRKPTAWPVKRSKIIQVSWFQGVSLGFVFQVYSNISWKNRLPNGSKWVFLESAVLLHLLISPIKHDEVMMKFVNFAGPLQLVSSFGWFFDIFGGPHHWSQLENWPVQRRATGVLRPAAERRAPLRPSLVLPISENQRSKSAELPFKTCGKHMELPGNTRNYHQNVEWAAPVGTTGLVRLSNRSRMATGNRLGQSGGANRFLMTGNLNANSILALRKNAVLGCPKRDGTCPGKESYHVIRSGASTLRRKISPSASSGCKMQNSMQNTTFLQFQTRSSFTSSCDFRLNG